MPTAVRTSTERAVAPSSAKWRCCVSAELHSFSLHVWSGGGRRANGHDMKEEEEKTEEKRAVREMKKGRKRK